MNPPPSPEAASPPTRRGGPPLVSRLKRTKPIPFGWYGGKFSHLDWLLPLMTD